jgi:hypothetical protein
MTAKSNNYSRTNPAASQEHRDFIALIGDNVQISSKG